MKKRRFVLLLSSVIIASVAFGCKPAPPKQDSNSEAQTLTGNDSIAPASPSDAAAIALAKPPEDRIIVVFDTLYEKLTKASDCNKLAKDIESYCEESNADLNAAMKELTPPLGLDLESAAIKKLMKTMKNFDVMDKKSACANDDAVLNASSKCIMPLVPVIEAFADETKKQLLAPASSSDAAAIALAKPPEDRIIEILDSLHSKYFKTTDCDKLDKDLDAYCEEIKNSLSADAKILMPASGFDKESPALKKVEKAVGKFAELDKAPCANNPKAEEALIRCLYPLLSEASEDVEIEEKN